MFVRSLVVAALACLATPISVAAADSPRMFQALPPPSCGTPLAATGKPLTFKAPLDEAGRAGLMAGLFLTLHDPTGQGWSEADLKAAGGCPVARFAADDVVWTLFSGAGNAPVRVANATGRGDAYFLVRGPSPIDAAAWSRTRRGLPGATAPPAYYLVSRQGDGPFFLFKVYDGPPAATLLADDIAAAAEAKAEGLAAYGDDGGAVSLLLETAAGPRAELFRPSGVSVSTPATLLAPDGGLVTEARNGDWVFRGSGFACRPAYGPFVRIRVQVLDISDEGLDLACTWSTQDSWTVVDATFMPDKSRDKAYVAERIRQEEEAYGVTRSLSKLRPGRDEPVLAGRWWMDKDGQIQTMYVLRRGDYLFEVRQGLARESDIDAGSKVALDLIDQISAADAPAPAAGEAWRRKR